MLLRAFNEQFGIGTIQVSEHNGLILGVSKLSQDLTHYALDVDTSDIPFGTLVETHMDIIIDDDYLYFVDSVSTGNTEYFTSASLDTKVLGFEDV